jgi:acid phosphatase type 7
MTIQWHTQKQPTSKLEYRSHDTYEWIPAGGSSIPLSDSAVFVHTIELTHLQPNTHYDFRFEEKGATYSFKTLPSTLNTTPLRFVTAGDAYMHPSLFKKIAEQIAKTDPDFIIVGGDIAYVLGNFSFFSNKKWQVKRWQAFFKEWKNTLVSPDGRLIPMLAILGNHDIRPDYTDPLGEKQPFFQLFAMPTQGHAYRSYIFGNYLGLTLLDTGHHSPISGEQTEWLRKTLKTQAHLPYRLAAYHIAAYPSVYSLENKASTLIRKQWSPLFEGASLQATFEHHNHALKRTHKIKNERVDPTGVTYLGDGCWGVSPRTPWKASYTWYLEKTKKVNHFWLTTLTPEQMTCEAFDYQGTLLDQVSFFNTH